MKPVEVHGQLVDALRLDLVGPDDGSELEAEILPQAPSRWYLTGFLVPLEAGEAHLKPTCEFRLDYEDEEDQELATSNQELPSRRRRKPWRYRWPDDFRDEVLARLLELNRQRAEEERLSGAAESGRGKSTKKSTKGRKADTKKPDQPEFFES
jgi:hypothetical protein